MSAPIPTLVKRWKCPHCNRHHSRKPSAIDHVARCWRNPDVRSCRTCRFYEYLPGGESCTDAYCPACCDDGEACTEGVELPEDGRPVVGCPLWEPRTAGAC